MPRKFRHYRTGRISRNGRMRTSPYVLLLTEEEHEYLTRNCYKAGTNMADYVRRKTFQPGWRLILTDLRDEQQNLTPKQLNPRYRSGNHKPTEVSHEQPHRSDLGPR